MDGNGCDVQDEWIFKVFMKKPLISTCGKVLSVPDLESHTWGVGLFVDFMSTKWICGPHIGAITCDIHGPMFCDAVSCSFKTRIKDAINCGK